jgi:Ca2+-binding EF-hand superfamily protein
MNARSNADGSGISNSSLNKLKNVFNQALLMETICEMEKQKLHSIPNFNLTKAFDVMNRVNQAKEDKVTEVELKNILHVNGVYTLDRDVRILLDRYDKNKDGVATFQDFANEVMTVPQAEYLVQAEIIPYR